MSSLVREEEEEEENAVLQVKVVRLQGALERAEIGAKSAKKLQLASQEKLKRERKRVKALEAQLDELQSGSMPSGVEHHIETFKKEAQRQRKKAEQMDKALGKMQARYQKVKEALAVALEDRERMEESVAMLHEELEQREHAGARAEDMEDEAYELRTIVEEQRFRIEQLEDQVAGLKARVRSKGGRRKQVVEEEEDPFGDEEGDEEEEAAAHGVVQQARLKAAERARRRRSTAPNKPLVQPPSEEVEQEEQEPNDGLTHYQRRRGIASETQQDDFENFSLEESESEGSDVGDSFYGSDGDGDFDDDFSDEEDARVAREAEEALAESMRNEREQVRRLTISMKGRKGPVAALMAAGEDVGGSQEVSREGFLKVKVGSRWVRSYFVLDSNSLSYHYLDKDRNVDVKDSIKLRADVQVQEESEMAPSALRSYSFKVVDRDGRSYHIMASKQTEAKQWLADLNKAVRLRRGRTRTDASPSLSRRQSSRSASGSLKTLQAVKEEIKKGYIKFMVGRRWIQTHTTLYNDSVVVQYLDPTSNETVRVEVPLSSIGIAHGSPSAPSALRDTSFKMWDTHVPKDEHHLMCRTKSEAMEWLIAMRDASLALRKK